MATQLKAEEAILESDLSRYLEVRVQRFIEDNKDALGECKITVRVFSQKEEVPVGKKWW